MNRLNEVVQRFRSGSVERDTEKVPYRLDVPETRSRSYSYNEADTKPRASSPRPDGRSDMETLKFVLSTTSAQQAERLKNSLLFDIDTAAPPADKKVQKKQPSGTFEYTVQEGDTLVKIGAHFDVIPSELIKINKLLSRTVFVGQVLYIPDSNYASSDASSQKSTSPVQISVPQVDITGPTDLPPAPGQTTQIIPSPAEPVKVVIEQVADAHPPEPDKATEGSDKEKVPKFLKMPSRRVLEEGEEEKGFTVKGTLLVTPNVIMFDPDVCDPLVIGRDDQQNFSVVVYMDEIRSVALFPDISPRMFWRQPKEIRAHSPKPEAYRLGQDQKPKSEFDEVTNTDANKSGPDGSGSDVDDSKQRGDSLVPATDKTSEAVSGQPSSLPDEVQHTPSSYQGHVSSSSSSFQKNSHSSDSDKHSRHETAMVCGNTQDFGLSMESLSSDVHNETPADRTRQLPEDSDLAAQGFQPLHFTDKSPKTVMTQPKAVPVQRVLVPPESQVTSAGSTGTTAENTLGSSNAHSNTNDSKVTAKSGNDSNTSTADSRTTSQTNEDMASKNVPGPNSSWSEKASTVVNKLAFQVSSLTWESADGSPKLKDGPQFSPLRAPAQQISSFFNYTSSLFRGSAPADKDASSVPPSDGKSKLGHPSQRVQLRSEFTKEDIARILGRDPKEYLLKSDSHCFEESPLYLQIRHGIRKNAEVFQPRAFDHWNVGPMLNEYWFVVPHDMGDKLYSFLMAWQPDAYGDEEDTESRGQFFYDAQTVESPGVQPPVSGDTSIFDTSLADLLFWGSLNKATTKTWEILSKEEYGAGRLYKQDTIDESNMPEMIGPTLIIEHDHIMSILRALPRSMSVGYNWELVYATHKHGYSLQNMYMRTEAVDADDPVLLLIKDTHEAIFGAYLSNTLRQNDTFYGSGATFLFTFYPEFKKFPWKGENQYFLHGTKDFFAIGSGEGLFGLWLDNDLNKGRSHRCTTFLNDVLATEEDFNILQLEVWKFVETSFS